MIEVRRLEQKHLEERRLLGLPNFVPPETGERSKSGDSKRRVKEPGAAGGGADTDLELALALSISAATRDTDHVDKNVDPSVNSDANKMWLPQPTVAKKRGKLKKGTVTVLQTRTASERQRMIGERVVRVLEEDMSASPAVGVPVDRSTALYWRLAATIDTVVRSELVADNFKHMIQSDSEPGISDAQKVSVAREAIQVSDVDLLSRQWFELLRTGDKSDVVIYCQVWGYIL